MSEGRGLVSIWFFIGVLLTAYGIVITGAGLYQYFAPGATPDVVLAELHATLWWGLILLAIGLVYFVRFLPKKKG